VKNLQLQSQDRIMAEAQERRNNPVKQNCKYVEKYSERTSSVSKVWFCLGIRDNNRATFITKKYCLSVMCFSLWQKTRMLRFCRTSGLYTVGFTFVILGLNWLSATPR